MARAFLPYPDPRLRAIAEPVVAVTDEIRAIWDEMLEAMYGMPGVGLAAPQLGIGLRLAVVDCSGTRDQPVRLANPVILSASDEMRTGEEGSPNLPGDSAPVARPARVEIGYLDVTGAPATRVFKDLWSASIQHQIDHLEGRMFFDRLSPVRRRRLLEQHRKAARKRARGRV